MSKGVIVDIVLVISIISLIALSLVTIGMYKTLRDCESTESPYCFEYICPNGKRPKRRKDSKACSAIDPPTC